MAAQILGLGAFDSTSSAQIIEPSPGISAIMGGAGVTDVARSLAAARGLLAAHGWVGGPRGRLYQLFTHCFF